MVLISFFTHIFPTPYIFKKPAKTNGANTRKKCVMALNATDHADVRRAQSWSCVELRIFCAPSAPLPKPRAQPAAASAQTHRPGRTGWTVEARPVRVRTPLPCHPSLPCLHGGGGQSQSVSEGQESNEDTGGIPDGDNMVVTSGKVAAIWATLILGGKMKRQLLRALKYVGFLPVLGCDDSTWKKLSREYEDCLMRWQQQLVLTDYKSKEFCGLVSKLR